MTGRRPPEACPPFIGPEFTESETRKSPPTYRLCFSAKTGIHSNGQASLSYPVEIGAAFERKDPTKGLIAKFHIIPTDFKEGVLFLIPATTDRREQADLLDDAMDAEAGQ